MKWGLLLPERYRRRLDLGRYAVDRFVERVASEVPVGSLVLDAGAGQCTYKPLFAHCRYLALDFAQGEPRWDYSHLDVIGDLLRMPLRDECVDVVICTQTLEHLAEPWTFLREVHRVLRPGGRLYLTAPQSFPEHQQPFDYFRFTRFGLEALLKGAGFRPLAIRPQGGYFWHLAGRLRPLHTFFFGKGRHWLIKAVMLPAELFSSFLTRVAIPLCCYHLDRLDHRREHTVGYEVVAEKCGGGPVGHPPWGSAAAEGGTSG